MHPPTPQDLPHKRLDADEFLHGFPHPFFTCTLIPRDRPRCPSRCLVREDVSCPSSPGFEPARTGPFPRFSKGIPIPIEPEPPPDRTRSKAVVDGRTAPLHPQRMVGVFLGVPLQVPYGSWVLRTPTCVQEWPRERHSASNQHALVRQKHTREATSETHSVQQTCSHQHLDVTFTLVGRKERNKGVDQGSSARGWIPTRPMRTCLRTKPWKNSSCRC